jgi:hypothetical protein
MTSTENSFKPILSLSYNFNIFTSPEVYACYYSNCRLVQLDLIVPNGKHSITAGCGQIQSSCVVKLYYHTVVPDPEGICYQKFVSFIQQYFGITILKNSANVMCK